MRTGMLWLTLIVLGACGTRYYGVHDGQATKIPEFNDTEPLSAAAVGELKKGTTVAFFPPDSCLDRRAAPSGTNKDEQVLRLQCGAVMTDLEKAAIAAGFEVVSWQSLRGSSQPSEYAKERSVDLLFEINELDTVDVADRDSTQTLSFYEHRGFNDDKPVTVGASVADRCRAMSKGAPGVSGLTASLDVKMVSVNSGRVLWNYRNTRNRSVGLNSDAKLFKAHKPSRWWAYALITLGAGVVYVGNGATPPTVGGLTVASLGVLAIVLNRYQSPDDVVCNSEVVADPFAPAARETLPVAEKTGSTFEYGTQTRGRDPLQELRMSLVKDLVADFTAQLQAAKR